MKVLLLNNQHLGMVVQWEDRFLHGNRAHTYLGPIDHPEAVGQGDGLGPKDRTRTSCRSPRASAAARPTSATRPTSTPALDEMIDYDGPYVLDVHVPVPGARAADDPGGHDGAGHHQGVGLRIRGPGKATSVGDARSHD